MKKIVFIFIIVFSISTGINAQVIKKEVELPLIEVTNKKVIETLDSLILRGEFALEVSDQLNKRFCLFSLRIDQDPEFDVFYMISLHLYSPEGAFSYDNLGVFFINEIPIIVERSCNPGNLFEITCEKERLSYLTKENHTIYKQEFPLWTFFYDGVNIDYINLPDFLVARLGFIPCK